MTQDNAHGANGLMALALNAAERPHQSALLAPNRNPLTYAQLVQHLDASHQFLKSAGLVPGEVAAVVLPSGPELITASLALAGLAACAPLDPTLTRSEYEFYLRRLGARSLVILDEGPPMAAEAALSMGLRIISIKSRADHAAGVFEMSYSTRGTASDPARKTDAAFLLFTSATTSSPKLVPVTWSNLRANAWNDSQALGLTASDRLLNLMPLFHLYGFEAVLTQLSCGGSVIVAPDFDPDRLSGWIADLRPTWLLSNPPMNRAILSLAVLHPRNFRDSRLRFIRSGTAASEPELLASLETAVGVRVINGYGMTETGVITRNTQRQAKPGSVGRTTGFALAVVDTEGNTLAPDTEGEIVVRGPSVMGGYVDNEAANERAFRGGWFHTGDIGRMDDEGFLYITGRMSDVINRGGKKIAPQDVEGALLSHPAVSEAAACAIPHPTLGDDVAAVVVLRAGTHATDEELRRFAATKLARFKVPRRIAVVHALPRTASGKLRRGELAERFLIPVHSESAPRTPQFEEVETILAGIWSRILNVERVDRRDDFFHIGGDSLSAAIMLMEVQRNLGVQPSMFDALDFFDNPTIETLSRRMAECGADPASTTKEADPSRVLALRSTGSRVPIFCFPATAHEPYYFRHLAKSLDSEQPFFVVRTPEAIQNERLLRVEDLARLSVEIIRSQRSQGPYILAGHCYGGVIAFESALQLISQGEQVISLILFDASTPGYPKVHKHWRRYISKVSDLARALGRGEAARTTNAVRQHIQTLGGMFAKRRKGAASRVLTAIGSDVLVSGRPTKDLNGMAMWEYHPRDFPARMIHFIAADHPVSTEVLSDPRLGWSDFAHGGLAVQRVPGDHSSLLSRDNAAALAMRINELLLPRENMAATAG